MGPSNGSRSAEARRTYWRGQRSDVLVGWLATRFSLTRWTVRLWDPAAGQEVLKLEFENLIKTLSFTNDNKILLTNQGTIEIEQGSRLVLPPESSPNQTSMKYGNWIRQESRDLLWLPQEYRNCSSAFNGNTFAFGLHSGQVNFIELDFPSKISHG